MHGEAHPEMNMLELNTEGMHFHLWGDWNPRDNYPRLRQVHDKLGIESQACQGKRRVLVPELDKA
jgi:hypothetical protein